MLENINLKRKLSHEEYNQALPLLQHRLYDLEKAAWDNGVPDARSDCNFSNSVRNVPWRMSAHSRRKPPSNGMSSRSMAASC